MLHKSVFAWENSRKEVIEKGLLLARHQPKSPLSFAQEF
jgi:hypothetical protein